MPSDRAGRPAYSRQHLVGGKHAMMLQSSGDRGAVRIPSAPRRVPSALSGKFPQQFPQLFPARRLGAAAVRRIRDADQRDGVGMAEAPATRHRRNSLSSGNSAPASGPAAETAV
jgi:hypothetical protein